MKTFHFTSKPERKLKRRFLWSTCMMKAQNGANRAEKNKKWNPADRRVQLGESSKRHEPPFVPVREALKEWIKRRGKEQSASRRSVPRSSIVPPNDPECEDAKGKTLKAMS
uniref:Uncharacterized protein n=1 Tax=Solanum tuberosum TaxID=4113 RepID=M1E084_SOLTU